LTCRPAFALRDYGSAGTQVTNATVFFESVQGVQKGTLIGHSLRSLLSQASSLSKLVPRLSGYHSDMKKHICENLPNFYYNLSCCHFATLHCFRHAKASLRGLFFMIDYFLEHLQLSCFKHVAK
jgi:hypothetical protein